MADIFGRTEQTVQNGLTADSLFMTFPADVAANGGLGLIVQDVQVQYRQPLRRFFEIGPGIAGPPRRNPVYYHVGRPEGSISLGRIFGPEVTIAANFYSTYGNPCANTGVTLSADMSGCRGTPTHQDWVLSGLVLSDYGFSVTAQDMLLMERVAGMIAGLVITN